MMVGMVTFYFYSFKKGDERMRRAKEVRADTVIPIAILKEWRRKDREAIAIHEGVSPKDMHLDWIDNSTVRHGNKIFAMYKHMVQVTYVEGINNKPQQVKVFDTVE